MPYIDVDKQLFVIKEPKYKTAERILNRKLEKTDVLVIDTSDKHSESDPHLKAIMNRFNRSSQKSFPFKKLDLMSEIKGRITEADLKKAYELGKAI